MIRIIDKDGNLLPDPFLDISSLVKTDFLEQGLLGLAFHPDYAKTGLFYVYYVDYQTNGDTVLAEFHVSKRWRFSGRRRILGRRAQHSNACHGDDRKQAQQLHESRTRHADSSNRWRIPPERRISPPPHARGRTEQNATNDVRTTLLFNWQHRNQFHVPSPRPA
jgi:hypothetical protein